MIPCLVFRAVGCRQLRSAAELLPEEKSRVSHRGQALRELVRQLRERDDGLTA